MERSIWALWLLGGIGLFALAAPSYAVDALTEQELARLTPQQRAKLEQAAEWDDKLQGIFAPDKLQEARELADSILATLQEVLGPHHPMTAYASDQLGYVYLELGEYAKARPYLEGALGVQLKTVGEKHEDTARTLTNLGNLQYFTGEYLAARKSFERAYRTRQQLLGEKHEDTAAALNNLGMVALKTGDTTSAREHFTRALGTLRALLGEQHADVATALGNLALVEFNSGNVLGARENDERALAIRRAVLGNNHTDTALSLNNLGLVMHSLGDLAAARKLLEQAVATYRASGNERSSELAMAMGNLANLLAEQGEIPAARALAEYAVASQKELLGERHVDYATALLNLAALQHKAGELAQAEAGIKRGLAVYAAGESQDTLGSAMALNQLGELYAEQGRLKEALPHFTTAYELFKKKYGEDQFDTADLLGSVSVSHAGTGDWKAALPEMDRARRTVRNVAVRILPALPERELLRCLKFNDEEFWHSALSLGHLQRADAQACELSAGWLINGKGIAQEALAQQALLARESRDPQIAATVKELLGVRRQLASLSFAVPQAGQEQTHRSQLQQLTEREQDLSRQVARGQPEAVGKSHYVEVAAVRKVLAADSTFVNVARFRILNPAANSRAERWQKERYVAWILPPEGAGNVSVVDLGEAAALDSRIKAYRLALAQSAGSKLAQLGEAEAEKSLRGPLEDLAQLLIKPLAPHLGERASLVISPDSLLWLAPWGALPLEDGRYAVEKYQIRLAVSGRDLTPPVAVAKPSAPVILADPNYDLGPADAEAATKAVLRNHYVPPTAGMPLARPLEFTRALPRAARLPGTAKEAQAIQPSLESFTGEKALLYTDRYALEGVLKKVLRPRTLVLSTHGFFQEDQAPSDGDPSSGMSGDGRSALLTSSGKPLENPLLRCGLLLAGCNRHQPHDPGDDGVLTGLEIVGTDLRGTELVVLSACETGLGEVRNGEGVAGLRQAFQLAGARAVVSTLWQVPDLDTSLLMNDFFKNLSASQSKAQALQAAQVARIAARREKYGAAHPFFWAAWTVTGN